MQINDANDRPVIFSDFPRTVTLTDTMVEIINLEMHIKQYAPTAHFVRCGQELHLFGLPEGRGWIHDVHDLSFIITDALGIEHGSKAYFRDGLESFIGA